MDEVKKEYKEMIISIEEISELLKSYQIGKKPLAKLLGWGETTIMRYLDGEVPTKEYAEKLNRIKHEPKLFYMVLQQSRQNITEVAYRKSKKAVLLRIFDKKIIALAQHLINMVDGETSPSRIPIVLFYAQVVSLVFFKKPIFQDELRITGSKPPYEGLYRSFYKQGCGVMEIPDGILSDREQSILKLVNDAMEWYGTKPLRLLFELDKTALQKEYNKHKLISKSQIQKYFHKLLDQTQCTRIEDFTAFLKRRIANVCKE